MKTIFEVNNENILEFAEVLTENDLQNRIIGLSGEEDILIEVTHTRHDRECMDDLIDLAHSED